MKRALAGTVLVVGVGLVGLAYGGRLLGLPLHGFVAQLATASASDSALSDALTGLASTPISTLRCASQAPLTAHQRPGAVWEQHRHWLELSRPHTYDHSAYRIGNLRTGVAYQWGYEGPNNTTDAAFGVPTSFAALHPEWAQDPWVLLSDCTEP